MKEEWRSRPQPGQSRQPDVEAAAEQNPAWNIEIFDPPLPAPANHWPKPFAEAYLTGPIPTRFKAENITRLVMLLTRLPEDQAAALVEFGAAWLDDRPCLNADQSLSAYHSFRLNPPAYGPVKFYEADPVRIVYEDRDLLVYNKESGRPSQAVPHDAHNNVLTALGRLLAARGDSPRLWLSHRLDADTSGLLLMAKNKEAAGAMGKAFQEGRVAKVYLCLGLGPRPADTEFIVNAPIAKEGRHYVVKPGGPGLESRTDFRVLNCEKGRLWHRILFQASPRTGRTHQIRLHLAWAGWPIAGDRFYGRPDEGEPACRLMLTSARLAFRHPVSGEPISISHPAWQFE